MAIYSSLLETELLISSTICCRTCSPSSTIRLSSSAM